MLYIIVHYFWSILSKFGKDLITSRYQNLIIIFGGFQIFSFVQTDKLTDETTEQALGPVAKQFTNNTVLLQPTRYQDKEYRPYITKKFITCIFVQFLNIRLVDFLKLEDKALYLLN